MIRKNILITGSNGFVGLNLSTRLIEKKYRVITFSKKNSFKNLKNKIGKADFIFHLAGVNRSRSKKEFIETNVNLTKKICEILEHTKKSIPIFFSSSTKVKSDQSIYSVTKLKAEKILKKHSKNKFPVIIARIPNVYGKWSKPDYNSFISTCCYRISRNLKVDITNKNNKLDVVYIDDLVDQLTKLINLKYKKDYLNLKVRKVINTNVGEIFNIISKFKEERTNLILSNLQKKLVSNLYSTFVSYLSKKDVVYKIHSNKNKKGSFTEFLKGETFGQISSLLIKPGKVRGNHYHHSKVEKFLVIMGKAKFEFQNIVTKNKFDIFTDSNNLKIVETIPGFSHNIKNIGKNDLCTLIWSNQIFNKLEPDTNFREIK